MRKAIARYKPDELTSEDYLKHLIETPEECIEKISGYQDLSISELVLQFPSLGSGDLGDCQAVRGECDPRFQVAEELLLVYRFFGYEW